MFVGVKTSTKANWNLKGGLAQMVERVLSMHEVPGSIPRSSTLLFVLFSVKSVCWCQNVYQSKFELEGGLAQMIERVLSMHEVPGSMPRSSTLLFVFFFCEDCLLVSKRLPKQIGTRRGD